MKKSMSQLRQLFYNLIDKKITYDDFKSSLTGIRKTKLIKGYLHGINAIIKGRKRKFAVDPNTLTKEDIKAIMKMIRTNVRNKYLPEFEKGYLYAWRDYLSHKTKLNK